jgi:hypothetical protein
MATKKKTKKKYVKILYIYLVKKVCPVVKLWFVTGLTVKH